MTLNFLRDGLTRRGLNLRLCPGERGEILLLRSSFLSLLFCFDVLLPHYFNGFNVLVNVFVFATFDRTVRLMNGAAEIFYKERVYAQHGVLLALSLHHIPHGERSDVAAVFEVAGIDGLFSNFLKSLAARFPHWKYA